MKYSKNFNRDFNWYLSMRNVFDFDGALYNDEIIYDKNGIDGKKAFHIYDSQGKYKPTKHPNILRQLLKVKGSVNLHIKMYAEDRAKGYLPKIEFDKICLEYNVPEWFINSVEKQKYKYYSEIEFKQIELCTDEELNIFVNKFYKKRVAK